MKRNRLYRLTAAGMTLTLALGLAACGSDTSDSGDSSASASASSPETSEESSEDSGVTTITAVTSGSPNPYITVDEDGSYTGYDIEVLKAVFEELPQYELEIVTAEFDGIFSGLTAGNYQIAVNNISYTDERAESYYYSYPYDTIRYVFVQRSDDEPLESLQDAADRGYTIESNASGNVTAAIEEWNEQNPDSQIEIIYSESDLNVWFEHIEDGAADFRIDDLPIYNAYIEEYGFDLQGTLLSEDDTTRIATALDSYFLFAKDEDGAALREEVNEVLKELAEDGTLLELSEEYLGGDQVPDLDKYGETVN